MRDLSEAAQRAQRAPRPRRGLPVGVLRCAALCCVVMFVLCCAVLYCGVLFVLRCAVFCCLCCAVLCCLRYATAHALLRPVTRCYGPAWAVCKQRLSLHPAATALLAQACGAATGSEPRPACLPA